MPFLAAPAAALAAAAGTTATALTVATVVKAVATFALKTVLMATVSRVATELLAPKQRQSARQASVTTLSLGENPREAIFGRAQTGGTLLWAWNYGGKNGTDREVVVLQVADHLCDALEGFWVDDQYYPFTADGAHPSFYLNGDPKLHVYWRQGTATQTFPASLMAGGGFTANDLKGVAYVVFDYKYNANAKVFSAGRPTFKMLVRGKRCYDARKDSTVPGGSGPHRWNDPTTWEWSENAYVCDYNYRRGIYALDMVTWPQHLLIGRGLSAAEAPPARAIAPANICDEAVPLRAGGTEPRYRVGGVIRADEPFIQVAEMFAAAMAGEIIQPEGTIDVAPGVAQAVVAEITDADLVEGEPVLYSDFLPTDERVNSVIPSYIEPSQSWQDHSAPVRRSILDIQADGGPKEDPLDLSLVTSGTQAQRCGEIRRRKKRLELSRTITLPPWFSHLEEGDWIGWTSERWSNGQRVVFQIRRHMLKAGRRNTLQLGETAASSFGWIAATDEIIPGTPPPPEAAPPPPLDLDDVAATAIQKGGLPAVRFTWATPVDEAITSIRAEVRLAGQAEVTPTVTTEVNAGVLDVTGGVAGAENLQVRLTPLGALDRDFALGAWIALTAEPLVAAEAGTAGQVPWTGVTDPVGTKPQDGADVTGENTSKDTANVGNRPTPDVLEQIDQATAGVDELFEVYGDTMSAAASAAAAEAARALAVAAKTDAQAAFEAAEAAKEVSEAKAGEASAASSTAQGSAASASGSASAAQQASLAATLGAAKTIPGDFSQDGRFFSQDWRLTPAERAANPYAATPGFRDYIDDPTDGRIMRVYSNGFAEFGPVEALEMLPGHTYKVSTRVRAHTDYPGSGTPNSVWLRAALLNSDYTTIGDFGFTGPFEQSVAEGWVERSVIVRADDVPAARWIRGNLVLNYPGGLQTWDVKYLRTEDITDLVSAAAALTSASSAAASESEAASKASVATTQAGIATTKAGEASFSAGAAAASATGAAGSASEAASFSTLAAGSAGDAAGFASAANSARASAEAAAASAVQSSTVAANVAGGGLGKNGTFSKYSLSSGAPDEWAIWAGHTPDRVAGYESPYAMQHYVTTTDGGVIQYIPGVAPGWFVLEADIEVTANSHMGAGLLLQGFHADNATFIGSEALEFAYSPDTTGGVSNHGVLNRRTSFRKLFRLTAEDHPNWANLRFFRLYAMSHWSGWGSGAVIVPKTVKWLRASVRVASPAEIAQPALVNQVNALQSQATITQGAVSALESKTLAWIEAVAASGGNEAFVKILAGPLGSAIMLAAQSLGLYNPTSGGLLKVLEIIGGIARFMAPVEIVVGASKLCLGPAFGAAGNLFLWFGPNIAQGAMTKANGIVWFDVNGDAYFGGGLSAGILKNSAQSTGLSTTESVELGPFGTNGGPKVITVTWTYAAYVWRDTNPTSGNVSTLACTLTLQKWDGANWVNLTPAQSTSGNGTFGVTAHGDPIDAPNPAGGSSGYQDFEATFGHSVSFTFTDNAAGTSDVRYRAVISRTGAVTFGGAAIPGQGITTTQRVSIISIEE